MMTTPNASDIKIDYKLLFETSLDFRCVAGPDGYFKLVSPSFAAHLGRTVEEMTTLSFLEFIHPDDVTSTNDEYTQVKDGEQSINFINRYQHIDGTWRWLEWTATPHKTLIYCVVRDVSQRVEADLERQRHAQLMEAALTLSGAGYYNVNLRSNDIFWSQEIFRIHGRDPKQGTPDLEDAVNYYHPEDRAKVDSHLQIAIETRSPFDFVLRLVRSDDDIRLVHSVGFPQMDKDHNVIGIFGIFRDLTDDAAVLRQEELEQFAYVASHDLHEPLRTISSFLELIDDTTDALKSPPIDSYWKFVRDAAVRMQSLVDDLLLFARAGRSIKLLPVDLGEVVDDVFADLGAAVTEHNVQIKKSTLPVILGEPIRMRQVFQNLIANAIKFGSGQDITITIEAKRSGMHWKVTVRDNGPGFDNKFAERIFDPFQRLQTDKQGTGIGLAVVRRIVRECEGSIWAESTTQQGAAFHMMFMPA